ncbi:hypothetical protein MGN70_013569 [Eutypa lata]|nr:hypothetical protein MGN70_013569 [Eutypa lata]
MTTNMFPATTTPAITTREPPAQPTPQKRQATSVHPAMPKAASILAFRSPIDIGRVSRPAALSPSTSLKSWAWLVVATAAASINSQAVASPFPAAGKIERPVATSRGPT